MIGVKIIESLDMVDYYEDWSRVRSPSRAIRRLRRGHRQNIVTRAIPKKHAISIDGGRTLIMHPEMAMQLQRMTKPVDMIKPLSTTASAPDFGSGDTGSTPVGAVI